MHLTSDICYFLLYHVARYRRNVVKDNLMKSFPEKGANDLKIIERQFYHNFCDLVTESLRLKRMNPSEVQERMKATNPELLEDLYRKGKNVFLATQHSGNWEWFCNIMGHMMPYHTYAVYKKLENSYFDRLVYRLRTNHAKTPQMMIEDRTAKTRLEQLEEQPAAVLILGDQSPRGVESDYWTEFLHRDTCWYTGIEKLAKKYDYAVVYVENNRTRRGWYNVTYHLICEDPQKMEDGYILEQYVRHVERLILDHPDNWLWTHRRWKHSRMKQGS